MSLRSLGKSFRFLVRSLADFLFPRVCFGCDEEIEEGLLCEPCRLLLLTSELDVCPGCGRPCIDAADGCARCSTGFSLSRVRALGCYDVPFHCLVRELKYAEKTALAGPMGQALAALAGQDSEVSRSDVLCPVPLHPARMRERGYNQSLLLAREVGLSLGKPVVELLRRVRNTESQTRYADDKARHRNVARAFRLKPGAEVAGKRVVLVDDVMTTGATLDAAGRCLLEAGASAVLGLVVAAARTGQGQAGVNRPGRGKQAEKHPSPVRAGAGPGATDS